MYAYAYHHFCEVINMKLAKGMLLVGLGVGATLAYQKYSKPAMNGIKDFVIKTKNEIDNDLDEMM